jgi:hypothetical protein
LEDLIEAAVELRVAIMDQEAQRPLAIIGRHQQVTRLLGCPGARRVRRAGDELDPPAFQREEEEHVDPFQPGGLDREEITRERRRSVPSKKSRHECSFRCGAGGRR